MGGVGGEAPQENFAILGVFFADFSVHKVDFLLSLYDAVWRTSGGGGQISRLPYYVIREHPRIYCLEYYFTLVNHVCII